MKKKYTSELWENLGVHMRKPGHSGVRISTPTWRSDRRSGKNSSGGLSGANVSKRKPALCSRPGLRQR